MCEATARAGPSTTLENLQVVEQRLCANSLDAVVTNLAANALQAQVPWIGCSCCHFGLRFV
jgi:hypothetical protein